MLINAIEAKQEKMVKFLEHLVNIDSGPDCPEGISEVAHIIGEKLAEMNFEVEYLDYPGICTHLRAKRKGSGDKDVMIIGHYDTLFPKGAAAARPFTIKDGRAYGPGVLDMKGGITIALFALEALYEAGWDDKNMTVLLCGDEDTNHPYTDAPELFEKEAYGKYAVFNMETASAGQAVLVGRKGNMHPEIVVKGVSAHAGADLTKGANAIVALSQKIIEVNRLNDFERGLTFNPGVITGGTVPNAVPDYASIKIDMRYLTAADRDKGIESLKQIASHIHVPGTSAEVVHLKENMTVMEVTEGNLRLYEVVKQQGNKLGIDVKSKIGGGSSDSGWTVRAGAPTLCSMGAIGEFNHTDREYILVDSLVERTKLLALSIEAV
ncbi:MAG: M20 family metallopeptidase [Negativicutes bacterium]